MPVAELLGNRGELVSLLMTCPRNFRGRFLGADVKEVDLQHSDEGILLLDLA